MLTSVKNGRPTEPSVKKLMDTYGALPPGTIITHEMIESVIGEPKSGDRYQSVVSAWKRRMIDEKGISPTAQVNVGYLYPTPSQQMREPVKRFRIASRQIGRAVKVAAVTPEHQLTAGERMAREHTLRSGAVMMEQAMSNRRVIALSLGAPVTHLPK